MMPTRALRTLGDLGERPFGVLALETWRAALDTAGWLSAACPTVAMAPVGLGTNRTRLRNLGLRPSRQAWRSRSRWARWRSGRFRLLERW